MKRTMRWAAVLAAATLTAGGPACAGPATMPASRPAQAAGRQESGVLRDIEYARAGEISLRLDVYGAGSAGEEKARPVVVWIHGGGWRSGSKARCPAAFLVQRGFAVVSIDYRLTAQATFPAQIHDCKAAIRWVRANAGKYNFDGRRIGVWGGSAGGHLVALLGTSAGVRELEGELGNAEQSSAVQAVCDWFGPTDFVPKDPAILALAERFDRPDSAVARLLGGTIRDNPDKAAAASPVTYVTAARAAMLPPFLIVHGDKDLVVPVSQSRRLAETLTKVGAHAELVIVPGGSHGLKDPPGGRAALLAAVGQFFDKALKPQPLAPAGGAPTTSSAPAGHARDAP